MAERPILLVSDSRGRLLDYALNSSLHEISYKHIWQSGLKLSNTAELVIPTILQWKPKLIYFLNGICDITRIVSHEPRLVAMRNVSPDITCTDYMTTVDQIHAEIFSLSQQVGHQLMIIFPSQTGVDLGKYNGYPDDLISPQQKPLNKAILKINNQISVMNRSMNIVTPFLASAVHMRCRGKDRLVSSKLSDGCHPTPELSSFWADRLHKNILVNLEKYDHYALINQMYGN